MHTRRMASVFVLFFVIEQLCSAQQPPSNARSFSFTSVDLDLLDKSNQLDKQLREKGLVYDESDTTNYLTKVGRSVLPPGPEPQNVRWQFFVLRDPIPNAFALPNGSIYVHSGLLAALENEAQLTGVLAHEEAHVLNRHCYFENRSGRKKAEAGMIVAGATSAGMLPVGLGAVALAAELAMPVVVTASVNGYARELEEEADLHAVHALASSGYSAEEMKKLFDELQQNHDVDLNKRSFYQNHPKLQERSKYVATLAASLKLDTSTPAVEADRYLVETENAIRHDAELEIRAGRARTAVWVIEKIVQRDDKVADNFNVLGDAYLGLGPRTPQPNPAELTEKGKEEARRATSRMTAQEYEVALLNATGARETLKSNQQMAENNYRRALEISPNFALPHRGLGFLYEQEHKPDQSAREFRAYLDLAPSALDSPQIQRRIAGMEKGAGASVAPSNK